MKMKSKRLLKGLIVILMVALLIPAYKISAHKPRINIQKVIYCDLDGDNKADDVYAEVFLRMFPGENHLVFKATLRFHGEIIYTIYRDNHVRTESEIVYKFYFYNATYVAGWYIFQVWFLITNGDHRAFLIDTQPFDPPEGDPDYPPG
ncbi:MAG: hypothetical protein ACTSUR_04420, partial [Candidatus Heimdallarchaeaceae archaeon]